MSQGSFQVILSAAWKDPQQKKQKSKKNETQISFTQCLGFGVWGLDM